MPLIATELTRAGGGAHQLHLYKSPDTIATISGSGYFNGVTTQLRQFDVITVVSETTGTPKVDNLVVTSATGAAVVTTGSTEGVTVS